MENKQFARNLGHSVITFLALLGWPQTVMAQSQPAAPIVKPAVAQVDRSEYPDAPRWTCDSLNLLVRAGVTEPLPAVYGGAKRVTRYEMAVDLVRLLDKMEPATTFALPSLARANADFYTRDEHGNWLPRYSRADLKTTLLKLCEEFAPEIERLGIRGLDGYSKMERRDRVEESPRQAINNYFAEPVPQPAPKAVEAHIVKTERLGYPFSPPNKTVVKLIADIALPVNCQLTVLPTWSWQLLSVQWRATAHDAWGQTLPPYTITLISPREAPTAHYECALQKAGQWQIKVQATVHYQTTCGSGAAVATDYVEDDYTPAEAKPQLMLPAPPTLFKPKTLPDREAH